MEKQKKKKKKKWKATSIAATIRKKLVGQSGL